MIIGKHLMTKIFIYYQLIIYYILIFIYYQLIIYGAPIAKEGDGPKNFFLKKNSISRRIRLIRIKLL